MSTNEARPALVGELRPGRYSDGHPLDEVQYLECKLILKPDRFTAAKVFFDFGRLVEHTAKQFGIGFNDKGVTLKPEIREVRICEGLRHPRRTRARALQGSQPIAAHAPSRADQPRPRYELAAEQSPTAPGSAGRRIPPRYRGAIR